MKKNRRFAMLTLVGVCRAVTKQQQPDYMGLSSGGLDSSPELLGFHKRIMLLNGYYMVLEGLDDVM